MAYAADCKAVRGATLSEMGNLEGPDVPGPFNSEVVEAAQQLPRACPATGAIANECTQLTSLLADIAAATGLPVFDMVTMIDGLPARLCPPSYRH